MKNRKVILVILFIAGRFLTGSAQQTKEVLEKDNVKHNITISQGRMYEGTRSKEARDFYNQAHDYDEKSDLKNAAKFYLKAIATDTGYVEAFDNLGLCYRRMGEFEKAAQYYKRSLALFPEGAMAHQNLAVVYGLLKDYKSADIEYRELIKISPSNAEGPFGLANLLMMQEKYDEALNYAGTALALYESQNSPLTNEGQYLTGLIYFYKGDRENAKKYLKLAKKNGSVIDPKLVKELR